MSNRNYSDEIRDLVDSMTLTGEFVARLVADDIVEKLRANDPELLSGWLNERAGEILGDYIRHRCNSTRSHVRSMAGRRAFAEAAEAFAETRIAAVFDPFRVVYVVNDEDLRRPVADMTGADHLYVASGYALSAKQSLMEEAFHRAVAKKVGGKRTSEVFTTEQYESMYRSITRRDGAPGVA